MDSTSSGEGSSGLDYLAEHIRQVLVDFVVGEAQDTNASLAEKFGAFRITRSLFSAEVNAAVYLDSQLMLNTEKVENELPIGMLPSKLKASQLAISQSRPESYFHRSLSLSQTARSINYWSCCLARTG